jgi:hypothetical protein
MRQHRMYQSTGSSLFGFAVVPLSASSTTVGLFNGLSVLKSVDIELFNH